MKPCRLCILFALFFFFFPLTAEAEAQRFKAVAHGSSQSQSKGKEKLGEAHSHEHLPRVVAYPEPGSHSCHTADLVGVLCICKRRVLASPSPYCMVRAEKFLL